MVESNTLLFDAQNRAFRYGDGVFETICVRNKKPVFLSDHWSRLVNSLQLLGIPLPGNLNSAALQQSIADLVLRNKQQHCRMRLIIYRVAEGLYAPLNSDSAWHLSVTGSIAAVYSIAPNGLLADVFEADYKSRGMLSNLKTLSALLYIAAGMEASRKGMDDLLIKNDLNHFVESTNSNLFLRKENHFITPPLTEGCLDGVMRKQVIRLLLEQGLSLSEQPLLEQDLNDAEELILTNVIRGAVSVVSFKEKQYSNRFSGMINEWLNNDVI